MGSRHLLGEGSGLGYYGRKAKSHILLIIARLEEARRVKKGSPCEYPIGRNGIVYIGTIQQV